MKDEMKLEDKDRALINSLIDIAWQAGAVKAPRLAQEIEDLRMKILKKEEPKE